MAIDGAGNVYVTGTSDGLVNEEDYTTIKYNSSGVEEWVTRYNEPVSSWDEANAMAIDDAGNVYVTGLSFDSGTYSDYATVKYDSEDVEQWIARYDGPGNDFDYDEANAIAIDGAGNVYVTGESRGSETSYDYATIKYNSSGSEQWVARYDGGGPWDGANAIVIDDAGNVYVTGSSYT